MRFLQRIRVVFWFKWFPRWFLGSYGWQACHQLMGAFWAVAGVVPPSYAGKGDVAEPGESMVDHV